MKAKHYHEMDKHGRATHSLALFTSDEFIKFWPQIEAMLDTVPHTWKHWTKEHIYHSTLSGNMQVWGIGPNHTATCVFFTQVSILPAMQVFCIVWAGGHFDDEMIPLLEAAWESYAQEQDCSEITVYGRQGWESKLRPLGFKRDAIVWSRPVVNKKVH